jgi:Zn-dependent protease with chaperone function
LAPRIVIVIGLALALMALGTYLVSLGNPAANFGWFGYAPLTRSTFVPEGSGLSAWQQTLIWIALILVWTVASLVILKRPRSNEAQADEVS